MSSFVSNESCSFSSTPSLGEELSLFSEKGLVDLFGSSPAQEGSSTREDTTVEKTNQVLEKFSFPPFESAASASQSSSGSAEESQSIDQLAGTTYIYPNGDEFRGVIQNGLPNGFGTLTYKKDQSWIMGMFENGMPKEISRACFFLENGHRYEGEVLEGKPHGIGRRIFKNGNWIESEYKQCVPVKQLRGRISFKRDQHYEGGMLDGKPHGIGKKIFKNGGWIEAEFNFGCQLRELKAQFYLSGGVYYEGEVFNSKPHGIGKKICKKGDWLEGRFELGVCKEGKGLVSLPGGHLYQGEIVDEKPHGLGKKVFKNGTWLQGQFERGVCKEGMGHILFRYSEFGNWVFEYEGMISDDRPHGIGWKILPKGAWIGGKFEHGVLVKELKGRLCLCDQIYYEGEILHKKAHGHGIVSNGGKPIFKGIFIEGLFAEVTEAIEVKEVLSIIKSLTQKNEETLQSARPGPSAEPSQKPQETSFLDGPLPVEEVDFPFEREEARAPLPPEQSASFEEAHERSWDISFLQTPPSYNGRDLSFEKEEINLSPIFSPASGGVWRQDFLNTPSFSEILNEKEREEGSLHADESAKRKRNDHCSMDNPRPQKRINDGL